MEEKYDIENLIAKCCGAGTACTGQWRSDTEFVGETAAMPLVQMGTYFDSYSSRAQQKHLELLTAADGDVKISKK